MKLCVFQGTFNPIHNAHIRVADYIVNHYNFDKILFIPAYNPPHKHCDLAHSNDRLEMVKLAVSDYPKFEVSDIEYRRGGKSYTYLTILELYKLYNPEGNINFLIGTDAFKHLESWYEFDKLKELVKYIVFVREDNFTNSKYDYLKDKGVDFEIQPLSYKDISSTELREKIQKDDDISQLVPKKVEEYINEHELYKNK